MFQQGGLLQDARNAVELPAIFVPFKRYSAAVIESVIEARLEACRTMKNTTSFGPGTSHEKPSSRDLAAASKAGFASPDIIQFCLGQGNRQQWNWLYHRSACWLRTLASKVLVQDKPKYGGKTKFR